MADHDQVPSPTGTSDHKFIEVVSPSVTVAASKQNMASVAARIAAIEQSDRCAAPTARQVVDLFHLFITSTGYGYAYCSQLFNFIS